jgi:predicted dehydrogenase
VANGEVVRLGVVGCGLISQLIHLPALSLLADRFRVVAVADPSERARTAAGGADAYASHEEMLERAGLDAVLVASPNGTHARVTLDARAAGLHVLVEKPMCITAADAARIVAADRVVQVGYMKRFDPAYEALQADIADDPPELLHVTSATYDPGLAADFGPPGAVDRPADPLLGALVHDVNAVHGLVGAAGRAVDGFVRADGRAAGGTVALPGGVRWTLAWLRIDGLGDFRERICLYARDDIRELEFPAPYLHRSPTVYRRRSPDGVTREKRSWRPSYVRQLEHFHECVTAGAPCRTPPEQARADLATLTAIRALA